MTEFHTPPNEARIDRLYAFMSVDDNGFNGIVAAILPGLGSTPLVTGSRKIAHSLIPTAADVARNTKVKVGLFVFERAKGVDYWMSDE